MTKVDVAIVLNRFITPYQPGIIQYGNYIITNNSEAAIKLSEIKNVFNDSQLTQSNKKINLGTYAQNLSIQIKVNDKYVSGSEITNLDITIEPGKSLNLECYIQFTNYGSWLIQSEDFEANPFSLLVDTSVKVNGKWCSKQIDVPFSANKG